MRKSIVIAFILIVAVQHLSAQKAWVKLDTTDILIGDQINLELRATVQKGSRVMLPNLVDTVTREIEILRKNDADTITNKDSTTVKQTLKITSFDTGFIAIPPFNFAYGIENFSDTIQSEPLLLHVNPVKVDTAQPIKTIKGPMEAPLTFAEMLPWILGFLALVLIAFVIGYIYKRRKKAKPIMPVRQKPALPPHVEAMNGLEELKAKKLWQNGRVKAYYSELTHILRIYIERKFDVPAVESTSNEILRDIMTYDIDKVLYQKLQEVLSLSDMVKFAKMEPLPEDNERSYQQVVEFVENTKNYGQESAEQDHNQGKLKESNVE